MTPRVVATDLDGTIVRTDGTIAVRTRDVLARAEAAGALVVLVTGRPPRWLGGIAEATGHHGVAVCANGALVYDLHREQVIEAHPLAPEVAQAVIASLRAAMPGLGFAVESVAGDFAHESAYKPRWPTDPGAELDDIEAAMATPMAKLLARHVELGSDELLAAAAAVVGEDLVTLTHSSRDGLLEISAAGVSKATTLAALCSEHALASADAIAFGDMPNDIPMLHWAGWGVAVANAHAHVLTIADEVTASNDDDGVAQVLERYF